MFGFGLTVALMALAFVLYLLRDQRQPITLVAPGEQLKCDYCGASDAGLHFNGRHLDHLCDRCHREAEQAQVRA